MGKNVYSSETKWAVVKAKMGPSIAERLKAVDERNTFGHWEIDTVIGAKHKHDAVLLTLAERQTRFEVILKIDGKVAQAVESLVEAARTTINVNILVWRSRSFGFSLSHRYDS